MSDDSCKEKQRARETCGIQRTETHKPSDPNPREGLAHAPVTDLRAHAQQLLNEDLAHMQTHLKTESQTERTKSE